MGNRKTGMILMLVLLIGLLLVPLAIYAQDGGDAESGETAKPSGSSFWELMKAGGSVGWFIVFCSFVSLALTIENFVNIKKDKFAPPEIVAELEALVEEGQYEDAVALCSANPNFFCNVVGPALAKVELGYDEMSKAMGEAGEEQATKVNMKISYLSLLGSVAPMLGLLGTVTGMITAFGVIKTMQSPPPSMLAKGVEEALVTTAQGLFVAIPTLTVFFVIKNKTTQLIIEMGMICGEFIDKFKNTQVSEKA